MTINTQTGISDVMLGDGVNLVFPFDFKIATASEIDVYVDGQLIDETAYTVSLSEDWSGEVTFDTAPVDDAEVFLVSAPAFVQSSEHLRQGPFFPDVVEDDLDKAAIRDIALKHDVDRAFKLPIINPVDQAGKFPVVLPDGSAGWSTGTGADDGLRTDLATDGEVHIASPEAGQHMADFRKRWVRYLDASATAVLAALLPIPANAGLVGNKTTVQAQVGHTGPTMFTLASGSQLGGVDVDGTNLPAPTANWFSGSPKGAAAYMAGADTSNRISGFKLEGVFRNLKNGGVNIEFAQDFDLGNLNFYGIQTDVTYALCAAVEMYQCREFSVGDVRIDGYRKKGVSLNYCEKATIGKIIGVGGLPTDALVHTVGGYLLDLGPIIHDGNGTAGYTLKAWDSRQLTVGMVQTRNVQEAIQCYGSHLAIEGLDALDHVGSAAQVDAYQARTSPQTTAECDFVCNGEFRAVRAVSGSTSVNALTVRTDPLTGCPIKRIKLGSMYVRGHYSAVYCQVGAGAWDTFDCGEIDVDDISTAGYLYFGKAKNFKAGFKIGGSVRNGTVAFTDADTRGGTFHITSAECLGASASWTTEPLIRTGYPGATSFSEAGFERIIIENMNIDGASSANLKLIDLRLHTGDYTREIVIRNIVGRNLVAAEQIRIELNAAATDVKLVLDNIDITDSSGNQLGITIVNGSRVTSGYIGDNVLPAITGRPAKCQPLYVQYSVDLSALASGATSGDQLVTVTGTVAGDEINVIPRNATLNILDVRVNTSNQIAFKVKNLGAGAGPNPALFDCFVRRSRIA